MKLFLGGGGSPAVCEEFSKTFAGNRRLYISDKRMCILFDRYAEMIGTK